MGIIRTLENINNKFFSKRIYYLYSMTAYHFIIILYALIGLKYTYHVFFTMSLTGLSVDDIFKMQLGNGGVIWNYVYAYLLILIIYIIDVVFLLILMFEFPIIGFNVKRIMMIETVLMGISFFIPY